jgi:hypothetical protein
MTLPLRLRFDVPINAKERELLELLVKTGLYGNSPQEAAERLIARGLEERFASRMPSGRIPS